MAATRRTQARLSLAIVMAALGFAVVTQFRAWGRLRVQTLGGDEQAVLLSELVDANRRLRAEVDSLRAQEAAYGDRNRAAGLEELVAELNRTRMLNGMVEVTGPGVSLVIDGPLNANDLQDILNELRNAGAEAIALNGHRLGASSVVIAGDQAQLAVDSQAISRPFRFSAVGDPATLETALLRPGGTVVLLGRAYVGASIQVQREQRVALGRRRIPSRFEIARPAE